MKKLSSYIFLILMWCNIGFTDRISFYDIKVGDKITDHFTINQIDQNYADKIENITNSKGEIVYAKDKIYSYISITLDNKIFKEDFFQSGIQVYYENTTDKIVAIGKVELSNNINDCIDERNKDASNYSKKNRLSTLFTKSKDTHTFPDGMVDHYISYEGKDREVSFRCYEYPDGNVTKRFDTYLLDFNEYIFKKFND